MKLKLVLATSVFFLFHSLAGLAATESSLLTVSEAGKAYAAGDYEKSVALYQSSIASGAVNGAILHNLGNAYYRLNRVGESVAAFRGASRFLPRDAEIASNLESARKRKTDSVDEKKRPLDQLVFWAGWASLREYLILSSLAATIMMTFVLLRRLFSKVPFLLPLFFAVFSILLGLTTMTKLFSWVDPAAAAVVTPEVSVKSGNGDSNVTLFVIHAGTEVVLGERRGEWIQVSLADERKGWVREEFLTIVASPALF